MAFLECKNVRLAGIAAGVPKNVVNSLDLINMFKDYDAAAFVETTGVKKRRISDAYTTSDLCYGAAEQLIKDLNWDKADIDAILFVSQTSDYILPATSCILQDRLGLSKECYATDIALGCSGWVYGLGSAVALMTNGMIKKALLVVGDTLNKAGLTCDVLFGDAGTVTALEYSEGANGFKFHFGTDGSGCDAVMIPDGGCRNLVSQKSFDLEEIDGKTMNRLQIRMKGMDVFSFGISVVPKSIKKLAEKFGLDYSTYDYLVFHQANMKMNHMISKKLKLSVEKAPSCMHDFGNTSSASIPLTIVTQLKGKFENKQTKFICCGFGVGLSWGTVAFETNNVVVSDLVEL